MILQVDLELATSALDKLLRSNELNFAFLAIVPSLVILSSTYAFLRQAYKQRRGIGTRGAVYQIRSRLLTIERILNKCKLEWKNNGLSSPTEEEIEFLTYGEILMELHLIRQYSRQVISKFNTIQDNNSFYQVSLVILYLFVTGYFGFGRCCIYNRTENENS